MSKSMSMLMEMSKRTLKNPCIHPNRRRKLLRRSMEGLCPRNHHSFLRTMNELTLILLIGLWGSKVWRSLKDHLRHFGLNCSQHNSKHDTANLLMLRQMVKMEEMLHQRMQLQMNERLLLVF
uniref:Uncharacterized protein n=1 Tax=Davidia involucrata TaxID=16924 RepID=A0A5B7BQX2_DAVIN